MNKRDYFIILLIGCFFAASLKAQTVWDENGVPIRQGKHIEWYRSADSDSAGYLYVTWSDCRTGDRDIYAQKYDINGNVLWTPEGVHVVEAEGRQEDPVIIADGSGGAIIAWVDVIADPECNVFCQRLDSDGNKLWSAGGVALNERISTHSPVNITPDGSGGAFVTWKDIRSAEDGDIYLTRVTSEGDIASGWPQNGMALCSETGEQSGASIGSDDLGGAIITWKDWRSGSDYDIYAQRVTGNSNLQWQDGGLLICEEVENQDQVKLWNDGDNGAIIVWRDRRNGSDTDIYAQRVDASGQTMWTPGGKLICDADGSQDKPRVIHDGTNGAIINWKDHRNSSDDWDLYAQRVNSDGQLLWGGEDVAICTTTGDQIEVRLTLVDEGEAVFVWVDQRDEGSPLGDIYAQRVDENGQVRWTTNGVVICAASGSQFSPLLRGNGSGETFAIWGDQRSGSIGIYAQHIDHAGIRKWNSTGLIVIDGISGGATELQIIEGHGSAIIVWEDGRRGAQGIHVYTQKVDINGNVLWTENGVGVDTSGRGSQSRPAIASDGTGGALIAWEDWRQDAFSQIYAQRLSGEGNPVWPEAVRVCATADDQTSPYIASDDNGGAIITWSDLREGIWEGNDVYAQRVDSLGNILWDLNGVRISPEEKIEYCASGIVGDSNGGAIILWERKEPGNQDLYAQRIDADGNIQMGWPEGSQPICTASGYQEASKIVGDGNEGAICVWEDSRNSSKDIYVQRVDKNGEIPWKGDTEDSLNGLCICQAVNDQSSPSITTDSLSGCFVAWHDFRDSNNGYDIFVQKINAAGEVMWTGDGINVCSAEKDQFSPVLVNDAACGAIIVWGDNRSDIFKQDLYAQRLDNSGMTQWVTNGIPVVQLSQKQSAPQMVTDGEGGAFVAWDDMRCKGKADTHDIYAQHLKGVSFGLRGDVTDDCNINVLDVLATLNHILGIILLDEDGQWRADCNDDERINILDALGIVNVILGISTCSP